MPRLPPAVRAKAAALGPSGAAFVRDLDATLHRLEAAWDVTVGEPLRGGTDAFVAAVTRRDGTAAVLKLPLPTEVTTAQSATLVSAAGRGYVRILADDPASGAVLLERLGPSLASEDRPVEEQLEVICAVLAQAWRVPPPPGLVTGAEKAAYLASSSRQRWEDLGRPCPATVLDQAGAHAARRGAGFNPASAVLVHGDAHADNVLRRGDGYALVDPDGLLAEPACDLAVPMREWPAALLADDAVPAARRRCARLAVLTGVEPGAIWEWGFLETVSTGLLCLQVGMRPIADDLLAVADALTGAGGP